MANSEKDSRVTRVEVRLPFGPVHPALKEPFSLSVNLFNEQIIDAELRLNHVYRGIEKLAESRNLIQANYLLERICGICSHTHTTCFIQAVEKIGRIEISPRAAFLRTFVFELERIHSHLLFVGLMGQELGFETLFMYAWTARELVLDLFEEITGNRVHHTMNVIGGVRWDLTPKIMGKVTSSMQKIESSVKTIHTAIRNSNVEKRLRGIGILSREEAIRTGVVGPVARASGLVADVRIDNPYLSYKDLKEYYSIITKKEGDSHARTEVRVLELFESIRILNAIMQQLPDGPIKQNENPLKIMQKIPTGEAISMVEAPRGRVLYFLKTNGKGGLSKLMIRTPTLYNILSLRSLLKASEIADIPAIFSSLDPCISCGTIIPTSEQDSAQTRLKELQSLSGSDDAL